MRVRIFLGIIMLLQTMLTAQHNNQLLEWPIIVPGQNGAISVDTSFFFVNRSHSVFDTVHNPFSIDLGQTNCIHHFNEQFNRINQQKAPCIIFATSQGTATTVNWLAEKKEDEQKRLVKCLILESVLGSFKRTTLRTTQAFISSKFTYMPFARLWIPVIANILFPAYNPFGKNLLTSARSLYADIPLIILHHVNDPQLSIDDAYELYCILKETNHNNVYFFEINNEQSAHFDIFSTCPKAERDTYINAIKKIYKEHTINHVAYYALQKSYAPNVENEQIDLSAYQPPVSTIKQKLLSRQREYAFTRNIIDAMSSLLLVGGLAYWYRQYLYTGAFSLLSRVH